MVVVEAAGRASDRRAPVDDCARRHVSVARRDTSTRVRAVVGAPFVFAAAAAVAIVVCCSLPPSLPSPRYCIDSLVVVSFFPSSFSLVHIMFWASWTLSPQLAAMSAHVHLAWLFSMIIWLLIIVVVVAADHWGVALSLAALVGSGRRRLAVVADGPVNA